MFRDKFIATFRRDLQDIAHFFVGCFSSTGDNLDQWRAYADNGRGFALGFDGPRLTTTFDAGGNGRSSFPIVYRQRRVNQPFKQLIDLLVPMIGVPRVMNLEDNDDIDSYMGELSALVTLTLVQLAMLVKHPAYKHEHEHRLLHLFAHGSPIAGVEYRMRRGSLTRYIDFDWAKADATLLQSIVVGPASKDDAAKRLARDCCRAFLPNADSVKIQVSKLPYRP